MKVKKWKYNDMMNKVTRFGDMWMYIDVERDSVNFDTPKVIDGFVTITCKCKVIKETEKAVYVELGDSWKEWFPKSTIMMN